MSSFRRMLIERVLSRPLFSSLIAEFVMDSARRFTVAPSPENLQAFSLTPGGVAADMLAEVFATVLAKSGATHYLTLDAESDATGPIEIIIRRRDGKTPAQVATALRGQRDLLRARIRALCDRMEVFIESDMTDEADQEAYDAARFAEAQCVDAAEVAHG